MDRRVQWKLKPLTFESQEAKLVRADRHQTRRQNRRDEQLNRLRRVSPARDDEQEFEDTPEERAIRLEKWKKERDLKKKLEAKNKRPAFVIGVPHHNFYSPASRDPPKPHCHRKPKEPSPPKRVTAVTQRRLAAKAAASAATPALVHSSQPSTSGVQAGGKTRTLETPPQPRVTRSRKKAMEAEKKTGKKQSLAPQDYEFKGPAGVAPIPLFGAFVIPDMTSFNFNLNDNSTNNKADQQQLKTLEEQNETTPIKADKERELLPKRTSPKKIIEQNSEAIITKESSPRKTKKSPPKKTSPEKMAKRNSEAIVKEDSTQGDSSIESVVLRMSSQFEPLKQTDEETEQEKENTNIVVDSTPSPRSFSPVPAQYSPFIVASRGKSSARKEQKQRLSLHKAGSPKDDIPTKDTVMQNLNISAEDEEKTSQYYKHLLQTEQDRLTSLCDIWKPIQEDPETPEDGVYMINQAIGQTNLLIRKKFSRFEILVLSCETGKGEQLVRCADLLGFWEMMEMEIRDCNARFSKLEQLKSRGWKEEEEEIEVKAPKRKPAGKKKKIEGKSNMRSFIEALRKKKMATIAQQTAMEEDVPEEVKQQPEGETKQSLVTPRRSLPKPVSPHSRAKITPRKERTSLLKMVQLTESAKRITQKSFAMVKVSLKAKTPEVKHDQSISYINSDQTPGKGILKKTEDAPKSEGRLGKLTYKVNFNDTVDMAELPEEEIDEVEQNKRSLAASLALIDSLDFGHGDEDGCVNKKLEFDDDDDDDDDNVFGDNVPASESEPEAPEGAMEVIPGDDENTGVEKDFQVPPSSLPKIEIVVASPPVHLMPPPFTTKSPKIRKSLKTGIRSPIPINIIEATPAPKSPETVARRFSALVELEKSAPSPAKPARRVKNKRMEEVKTEDIVTIDITTPEEKPRRRGRSDSVVLSTPGTPKNISAKLITPKSGGIKAENGAPPVGKTNATPKTPKKGRKKSSVGTENEKPADSVDEKVSTGKIKKKSASIGLTEAVVTPGSPPKRQLRNRSVLVDNITYRKRRTSTHKIAEDSVIGKEEKNSDVTGNKENSLGVENQKFQSPKTPRGFSKIDSPSIRRSARKSVRFVPEDDCATCKPVPLTPRSLKARISFFGDPELILQPLPNGDLITFDSPKTPRARLRRSSTK